MRELTHTEKEKAKQYFDSERRECVGCPYTAKVAYKTVCGMVYYDCLVSVPVCLERR